MGEKSCMDCVFDHGDPDVENSPECINCVVVTKIHWKAKPPTDEEQRAMGAEGPERFL